jgi:hypothetical protein
VDDNTRVFEKRGKQLYSSSFASIPEESDVFVTFTLRAPWEMTIKNEFRVGFTLQAKQLFFSKTAPKDSKPKVDLPLAQWL